MSLLKNQLIGLASLTEQVFRGVDLNPLAQQLIDRIESPDRIENPNRIKSQPDDAAALMDLAMIYFLYHDSETAIQWQQAAMEMQSRYTLLSAPVEPAMRMLAFMGSGGLMDNLPLEFLLEGSAIAMDLHYMQAGSPMPPDLATYDVLFVAVGESDTNTALLQQLETQLQDCPVPVLNRPACVMQTTREAAARALQSVDSLDMPMSVRLSRAALQQLANSGDVARYLSAEHCFPIIVRPVESHGGHGLERIAQAADIAAYLREQPEDLFYISRFVNYASADAQFRKYRIVLIEGEAFVCHLAISSHWMVHYLNAGMIGDAEKCAEEAACMADFDAGFGRRHAQAFAAIYAQMQLEYLIIDCAESEDGKLLVFEVDTSAIVHAMDSPQLFPYKQPQMHKIFRAFQAMLARSAGM